MGACVIRLRFAARAGDPGTSRGRRMEASGGRRRWFRDQPGGVVGRASRYPAEPAASKSAVRRSATQTPISQRSCAAAVGPACIPAIRRSPAYGASRAAARMRRGGIDPGFHGRSSSHSASTSTPLVSASRPGLRASPHHSAVLRRRTGRDRRQGASSRARPATPGPPRRGFRAGGFGPSRGFGGRVAGETHSGGASSRTAAQPDNPRSRSGCLSNARPPAIAG